MRLRDGLVVPRATGDVENVKRLCERKGGARLTQGFNKRAKLV